MKLFNYTQCQRFPLPWGYVSKFSASKKSNDSWDNWDPCEQNKTLGFRSGDTCDSMLVSKGQVLGTALVNATVGLNYHCVTTPRSGVVPHFCGWSPHDHRQRSGRALIDPSQGRRGKRGRPLGKLRKRTHMLNWPGAYSCSLRHPNMSALTWCSLSDPDHFHLVCSPFFDSVFSPALLKLQIHRNSPRPSTSGLPVANWCWLVTV